MPPKPKKRKRGDLPVDGPEIMRELEFQPYAQPSHQRMWVNEEDIEKLPQDEQVIFLRNRMPVVHQGRVLSAREKEERKTYSAIRTVLKAGFALHRGVYGLEQDSGKGWVNLDEFNQWLREEKQPPAPRPAPRPKKKPKARVPPAAQPGLGLAPMDADEKHPPPNKRKTKTVPKRGLFSPSPARSAADQPEYIQPPDEGQALEDNDDSPQVRRLIAEFAAARHENDLVESTRVARILASLLSYSGLIYQQARSQDPVLRAEIEIELARRHSGEAKSQSATANAIRARKATPKAKKLTFKSVREAKEKKAAEDVFSAVQGLPQQPGPGTVSPSDQILFDAAAREPNFPNWVTPRSGPAAPARRSSPDEDLANAAALGMSINDYHRAVFGSGFVPQGYEDEDSE